jgi:hypothetical protein
MAPRTFSTCARQRLYTFARRLATPFTDSRRRRFLTEMIPGLVIANHVHLSKIARAIGHGIEEVHAAELRCSINSFTRVRRSSWPPDDTGGTPISMPLPRGKKSLSYPLETSADWMNGPTRGGAG